MKREVTTTIKTSRLCRRTQKGH